MKIDTHTKTAVKISNAKLITKQEELSNTLRVVVLISNRNTTTIISQFRWKRILLLAEYTRFQS